MSTIPCVYFGGKGGKSGVRDAASYEMLAKHRIVMLEKWEGGCWDECMANASRNTECSPSCNVERDSLATLKAVRAINPNVSTALYLNTLLLFPFYDLAKKYIDADALLIDSRNGKPIELMNDDGMRGVYVPDFGTVKGRDLWLDTVKSWLDSGLVDGIFADKWPDQAHGNKSNSSEMLICNHVCGHVTTKQGEAWNQGKKWLRGNVSELLRINARGPSAAFGGLLYGDGCHGCYRKTPRIDGNFVGPWIKNWQFTPSTKKGYFPGQNVWKIMRQTHDQLHKYNYSHVLLGCGDHHPSDGQPFAHACEDDLCTDCTPEGIAIFLLVAETGVLLGSNGWSPVFERPLGQPTGPPVNVTNDRGEVVGLQRSFASGTKVYYNLTCVNAPVRQSGHGCSRIEWGTWEALDKAHSTKHLQETSSPRGSIHHSKSPRVSCMSDLDCSLNGVCAASRSCVCDPGWHGQGCELLNLSPTQGWGGAYGYPYGPTSPRPEPNISSWGAHVVKIAGDKDTPYHMFVSEFWGHCGVSESWRQDSHVVHATAPTPLGPFTYQDTALPPEATCMHMVQNGSTLIMWHQGRSGDGKGNRLNCSNAPMNVNETWTPVAPHKVHESTGGPGGPWRAGGAPMPPGIICNNPSAILLSNGTFAVFCHGPGIRLWLDAEGGALPVRFILQPNGGPRPHSVWEDPHTWIDKRGHWHLLSHVYPTNTSRWSQYADIVAGHAYSVDGEQWTFHPTPPYTADIVDETNNITRHFATRERPFLLLSDDGERTPIALYTAVTPPGHPKQNWTKDGGDYSFTHVQPVSARLER